MILRSHGVPREVKEQLDATDAVVVDATCTFVKSAQEKAAKLQRQGYFVIILGETDHPGGAGASLVRRRRLAGGGIAGRPARGASQPAGRRGGADHPVAGAPGRVGGVSRAAHARAARVQHHLQRHRAAADGRHGHGRAGWTPWWWWGGGTRATRRRLAELCAARQPKTYHVESADELDPEWFRGLKVVGITAGASTPPEQIKAVADRLAGFET